jgi:hypothetical protein
LASRLFAAFSLARCINAFAPCNSNSHSYSYNSRPQLISLEHRVQCYAASSLLAGVLRHCQGSSSPQQPSEHQPLALKPETKAIERPSAPGCESSGQEMQAVGSWELRLPSLVHHAWPGLYLNHSIPNRLDVLHRLFCFRKVQL